MCACQELLTCITHYIYQAVFNNEGQSSILSEIVARCRDGEVHIQCDLKLTNLDLGGRMSWYTPPCSYTFSTSWFSMLLLDRGHHPYISIGL